MASLSTVAVQVLQCVACGLSTEEVAARLGIPVTEVRQQLDSAHAVLGSSSWLDAVVRAARQGLIEWPRYFMDGMRPACSPGSGRSM
jgi:DNA-binding NarL/FixJ family response regulator